MNKKLLIISAVVCLAVAALAFYSGMQYGKNIKSDLRGLGGQFQQRAGSSTGMPKAAGGLEQGGFSSGEIISKDGNLLTIKLKDGGTALVLLSESTTVNKYAAGTLEDLAVGKQIMVSGDKNSDGSISAKSVQLQPAAPKAQG